MKKDLPCKVGTPKLTKLEYFAGLAMHAIEIKYHDTDMTSREAALLAVGVAQTLLERLVEVQGGKGE